MRIRTLAIVILALSFATNVDASGPAIGIFADPEGTNCSITAPSFAPVSFYVLALVRGEVADGITGAEFRLEGLPATFTGSFTPNPAASIVLGNLVTGCDIAFPECQTGAGGVVLLYSYSGFNMGPAPTGRITINRFTSPIDANFTCPNVTKCDAPAYSMYCATGMQAVLNGSCTVGVAPQTWSNVKSLYAR